MNTPAPQPGRMPAPTRFAVGPCVTDTASGTVRFPVAFDDGRQATETIEFGASIPDMDAATATAFHRTLTYLSWAIGISYYKAFIPPVLTGAPSSLSPLAAEFFTGFYKQGLGEFAARNNLHLTLNIDAPTINAAPQSVPKLALPNRYAVLVGGGKDSIAALEIMKEAGKKIVALAVNPNDIIHSCAKAAGIELIAIKRTIDPVLFEWNEQGAYNGHVPATGIVMLTALAAAFIHGFDHVVAANERSADEGNTMHDGQTVNHQYSKSFAFEQALSELIANDISPTLSCFSLLRPWSEARIARAFARTDVYDSIFASCNRNFVIRGRDKIKARWCGECPKCRFAFLVLATAMPKERLLAIFPANFLDDAAHTDGFSELAGLTGHKPWECVGELAESQACLWQLSQQTDWRGDAVIKQLAPLLPARDYSALWEELMRPAARHNVPADLSGFLA